MRIVPHVARRTRRAAGRLSARRPIRGPRHRSAGTPGTLTAVAGFLVVMLAVVAAVVGGTPAPKASAAGIPPQRIVTGWLPYWSATASTDVLVANRDLFTDSSPFWFTTSSATTVSAHLDATTRAGLTARIHGAGVSVIPTVTDGMAAHGMSAVLRNATTRAQHVAALVAVVTAGGYDGIDLDYEKFAFSDGSATWSTTRPAWVAFIAQLSSALHARGKKLTVAVPVMYDATRTATSGYWVYDYAGIGPYVDRLRIMTYDYSTASPGPIAPIAWVRKVAAFAATQIAPSKIQLGVPAYGRDWPSTATGCPVDNRPVRASLTSAEAKQLAASVKVTPTWNPTFAERTFTYRKTYAGKSATGAAASCTVTRTVWYEEASAAVTRAQLVPQYGLGGIAFWTIGGEDPAQWSMLRSYALSIAPKQTVLTIHPFANATTYGTQVTVQGILRTTAGVPVVGVHLLFQGHRTGSTGSWTDLGLYTTSTAGVVNATHTPTAQTEYRFVFSATGNALASTSPVATVTVELSSALVYTTEGYHTVADRSWYTSCTAYSTGSRCSASIWATHVRRTSTGYAAVQGWVLNNLTYVDTASPAWDGNPLAHTGTFTSAGRQWKVSCTPDVTTGPRTCTAYVWSTRVTRTLVSGRYVYHTVSGWTLNDVVILS